MRLWKKGFWLLVVYLVFLLFFPQPIFADSSPDSEPVPGKGRSWTEPTTGMEFVWIEGGCFWMGPTEEEVIMAAKGISKERYERRFAMELPRHEVCVDGFWMGKFEVTNAQFRRFRPDHDSGNAPAVKNFFDVALAALSIFHGPSQNGDQLPVAKVNWDDAMAFSGWLGEKNGKTFRLPTEAEWEYAVRAGTTTPFFWGDNPEDACRHANIKDKLTTDALGGNLHFSCNDGFAIHAPVGSFEPNPWGLYDMVGNAKEWCFDWYAKDYYQHSPKNNPKGPEKGIYRVRRDGGLQTWARGQRSAARFSSLPDHRSVDMGFRLIIDTSPEENRRELSQ